MIYNGTSTIIRDDACFPIVNPYYVATGVHSSSIGFRDYDMRRGVYNTGMGEWVRANFWLAFMCLHKYRLLYL